MVIEDVDKAARQLGAAYKKQAASFLLFAKHALADCFDFEGEEKTAIGQSFLLFEMVYGRFTLFLIKKIKKIQDKSPDFKTAFARFRDLDLDHALDRAHACDLARAHDLILDLALAHDHDYVPVHELALDLDLALKEEVNENIQKMQKNCAQIIQKSRAFLADKDERYVLFSSLVVLLMGIITSYRWYYMKEEIPWNYPDLDSFIETGGGLIKEKG